MCVCVCAARTPAIGNNNVMVSSSTMVFLVFTRVASDAPSAPVRVFFFFLVALWYANEKQQRYYYTDVHEMPYASPFAQIADVRRC